jgi:hypothetical protein
VNGNWPTIARVEGGLFAPSRLRERGTFACPTVRRPVVGVAVGARRSCATSPCCRGAGLDVVLHHHERWDGQFDPEIVQAFVAGEDDLRAVYEDLSLVA